jgi:hypothetical protein
MPFLSKLLSCFCADDRTNPPQLGDIGRNRGGTHALRCRCSVLTHTECDGAPVLASVRESIPPRVRRRLRHASPFPANQFISSGRGIPGNASGSLSTNKLGSDGLAEPPDYLICAIQLGPVAGEKQYEFIGNAKSEGFDPYAAIRKIGDKAGERRTALDSRQALAGIARRPSSFLSSRLEHDARLRVAWVIRFK